MAHRLKDIPGSVLDLATVREGDRPADALARSLTLARAVERFGYTRIWYAEHHNMENIASSATAVLIGYIAGGTTSIRVGSGGIMLPNHAPLIVAEQFGTLEALYPGRIDLGLGRAPGTDPLTSRALRRGNAVDDFPADVQALRSYLAPYQEGNPVRAIPGEGSEVPIWLLGSSTFSARLAAALGLPFAFASHFAPTYLFDALEIYRENFRPSSQLQAPYALACINVIAADTDTEANRLASSFYGLALGIIRDRRRPLQPPVDDMDAIWSVPEREAVRAMMQYSFVGRPATIQPALEDFVARTAVDEIMICAHVYDEQAKIRSYEMISGFFRPATSPDEQKS
jgi:luciferase family oxidoreductase group 1